MFTFFLFTKNFGPSFIWRKRTRLFDHQTSTDQIKINKLKIRVRLRSDKKAQW